MNDSKYIRYISKVFAQKEELLDVDTAKGERYKFGRVIFDFGFEVTVIDKDGVKLEINPRRVVFVYYYYKRQIIRK